MLAPLPCSLRANTRSAHPTGTSRRTRRSAPGTPRYVRVHPGLHHSRIASASPHSHAATSHTHTHAHPAATHAHAHTRPHAPSAHHAHPRHHGVHASHAAHHSGIHLPAASHLEHARVEGSKCVRVEGGIAASPGGTSAKVALLGLAAKSAGTTSGVLTTSEVFAATLFVRVVVSLIARLCEFYVDLKRAQQCQRSESGGRSNNHQFSVNFKITESQERLHVSVFERDETEAFASPRLAVQHDSRVDDFAKLREELAHRLGGDAPSQTTDEEFRRSLVLLAGNGAFWVDLASCKD